MAKGADLDTHRVDHERVALVMANGIPIPGGRYMLRMRAVHIHVADIIIVCVENRDFVILLQHLHADVPKHEGHAAGPTLVAGCGIGNLFLESSPCCFTTSAASGFKIGLVKSPTSSEMLLTPLGLAPVVVAPLLGASVRATSMETRERFRTGP